MRAGSASSYSLTWETNQPHIEGRFEKVCEFISLANTMDECWKQKHPKKRGALGKGKKGHGCPYLKRS